MNFDPTELRDACKFTFDPRTLERARSYFKMGNVAEMEWQPERHALNGTVLGNFSSSYRVEVEIERERNGVTIDSECECPVSYNCKHGAALVLGLVDRIEEAQRTQDALGLWQETLQKFHPGAERKPASDQINCMVYELSFQHDRDQVRVNLDIATARRLKKGGIGKRSWLSSYDYINNTNQSIQDDTDREIMRLVNASRSQFLQSTTVAVEGEIGGLLIPRLLLTGRCYLAGESAQPLDSGPALVPSFSWEREDDKYKLICTLPGVSTTWVCTPTVTAFYIDTSSLLCGELITAMAGKLTGALRLMPAVEESQARKLARTLLLDEDLAEVPPAGDTRYKRAA